MIYGVYSTGCGTGSVNTRAKVHSSLQTYRSQCAKMSKASIW